MQVEPTNDAAAEQHSQNGAVVTAQELTRRYGEGDTAVDALRGVSLEVAPKQLTAIMGPSGSGKSTLMHILAGARPADVGLRDARGHAARRAQRHGDHEAPAQAHRLRLPVLQPAADAERRGERPCPSRSPDASRTRPSSRTLIEKVGLQDRLRHRPSELSGGQQQRVAIARALVSSRPSSSPTSRPGTSTRRRAARSSSCCTTPLRASARRWSWSRTRHTRRRSRTGFSSSPTARSSRTSAPPTSSGSSRRSRKSRSRDRVALRGLAGRKLRAVLTAFAIVLGVAMTSGTLVLTNAIDGAFKNIFTEQYAGTDAVISGKQAITFEGEGSERPSIPASLLRRFGSSRAWPRPRVSSSTPPRPRSWTRRTRSSTPGAHRRSASASTSRRRGSTR